MLKLADIFHSRIEFLKIKYFFKEETRRTLRTDEFHYKIKYKTYFKYNQNPSESSVRPTFFEKKVGKETSTLLNFILHITSNDVH